MPLSLLFKVIKNQIEKYTKKFFDHLIAQCQLYHEFLESLLSAYIRRYIWGFKRIYIWRNESRVLNTTFPCFSDFRASLFTFWAKGFSNWQKKQHSDLQIKNAFWLCLLSNNKKLDALFWSNLFLFYVDNRYLHF